MAAFNFNSPRYQLWFVGQQTDDTGIGGRLLKFANPTQLIGVDQGTAQVNRNAPYLRYNILTGTRSNWPGIRGRKGCTWALRGVPLIPSGTSAAPDSDIILQNIFGQAASGSAYTFFDGSSATTALLPFSLYKFNHNYASLTAEALWGCMVQRVTFRLNENFLVMDLEGFAGYNVDTVGVTGNLFDSQALAGFGGFSEPGSAVINGRPITGFGHGYTATITPQGGSASNIELKIRALSVTIDTGWTPIADVYGSPYLAAAVGDARTVSVNFSNLLDDDSAELTAFKAAADKDHNVDPTGGSSPADARVGISIVAGNTTGNKFTFALKNVLLSAFNLRDNGPTVALEIPTSSSHATPPASGSPNNYLTDDFSLAFS